MIILDSGGLSRLARRDRATAALLVSLRRQGLWPALVPAVVLTESLTGSPQRDANTNRFLKSCEVAAVRERDARRAAHLRTAAGRGSAVDALVVTAAEPGGKVLTGDPEDLGALASYAVDVDVLSI